MSWKKLLLLLALLVLLGGALYLTPALAAGPYQAESATLGGGVSVDTNHAGYTGTGFVNFPANGGYVEFRNVDGGTGGSQTLKLRYALGATSARTGRLTVNGAGQNITFGPTGGWSSWVVKDVAATLTAGATNTIRLASTGQDLANLDQMEIGITPTATFTITPTATTPVPCGTSVPPPVALINVAPITLEVGQTLQVEFGSSFLEFPDYTLYAGDDIIAVFQYGGGVDVYNESPIVRLVSGDAYPAVLEAIAPGAASFKVRAVGETIVNQYGYPIGVCIPVRTVVSAVSSLVPVSVSGSPILTPTPTLASPCGTPMPDPSVSIDVAPTILAVGETMQVGFATNLGMPQYTLYDGNYKIAVFQYGGGVDVYNESPIVRLVSGDAYPAVLEAIAPGAANLRVAANGEMYRWTVVDGRCVTFWNFVTVASSPVPVSVSGTADATNTPTPTVTVPPPPAPCFYTYANQNDWGNGATINVTIRNNLPNNINGWTVTWTFPGNQQITNLWNGSFTQSGASVSVRDAGWNATIGASSGTVSFGFNIAYSGSNAAPARVSLNGNACQVMP